MQIEHLLGLSCAFEYALKFDKAERVTMIASRFVASDMGAAAAQRHMPATYHAQVNVARKWLREADEVIEGFRERTHDAALERTMAVRRQASQLRALFTSPQTPCGDWRCNC